VLGVIEPCFLEVTDLVAAGPNHHDGESVMYVVVRGAELGAPGRFTASTAADHKL